MKRSPSRLRGALPLVLVCVTLIGSVAIPARQTWLITHILRETVGGLAPARLVVEQLQSGLGKELVTLQSYAITGDDSLIGEYRATAAADFGRVTKLRELTGDGDAIPLQSVDELALHMKTWHDFVDGILARSGSGDGGDGGGTRASLASDLGIGEGAFDSSTTALAALSQELAALSDERDERVSSLEKMSIAVNAVLVLAAMVAMAGVLRLTLRERRLAAGLERVVESRSRLMRGFSHDVKNPIGAADGFAELLSMGLYGDLNDEQHASVERMRRALHTALGLIDDLHELARAETGVVALASERVDLVELVKTMGEEYNAAAAAGGLELVVDADSEEVVVVTDRARVLQIAGNLLSNAIKYTEHGRVELRVVSTQSDSADEAGRWVRLEVVDTGIGIAQSELELIFEEFRRGNSRVGANTRSGAGLGLAISRLLAQALGGRITVQSEEGQGSTFTLWLPTVQTTP